MKQLRKTIEEAVQDLLYLLEKGYPRKSAIALVGNRYRLSGNERMVLYRGVFTRGECESRTRKRVDRNQEFTTSCVVDGYNVFITIESYLRGRVVFRALDGFTRDISGVYGNYTFGARTEQATDLLIRCLLGLTQNISHFLFFLDEPVSRSGEFARFLREALKNADIPSAVEVVRSPDTLIGEYHARDLIATSDTVLIDRVERCTDFPGMVLSSVMGKEVLDLQALMEKDIPWIGPLR